MGDMNFAHPPHLGETTRELYVIFNKCARGQALQKEKIAEAFHEINVFPSKSQVYEMVQCAMESSRRMPATDYITFGAFCYYAVEIKHQYENHCTPPGLLSKRTDKLNIERRRKLRAVFLGGSCNPTTWRSDIAIPALKQHNITYYNPQVTHWVPEMIELEDQAKQAAHLLFFVMDNQTRSVASIVEAAYMVGSGRHIILVIKSYSGAGSKVLGEPITCREYEDLVRGQRFLHDLAERRCVPVFDCIHVALTCTIKCIREGLSVQDLWLEDGAQPVRNPHLHVGDRLLALREAFDSVRCKDNDFINKSDLSLAYRSVSNKTLPTKAIAMEEQAFTFEDFCCIAAEHKYKQDSKVYELGRWLFLPLFLVVALILKPFNWFFGVLLANNQRNGLQSTRDVYLGGSIGNSRWCDKIAIPMLLKNGLTYFNPQTYTWNKRIIPLDGVAKSNSRLLLFVVTADVRGVAAMAEAAFYIGQGCSVVLCLQTVKSDCIMHGEQLSEQAVKDYNRGRTYLADIANREGVPVFDNITEAVQCVIDKINARRK